MPRLIFFYLADYEILELSGVKGDPRYLLSVLDLELKLLVLLSGMDDCVVLSPSQYREEDICRRLVHQNLLFKEEGFLRLIMRETTLQENKEKQAERYKRFERIEKYRNAYLSESDYGLNGLGFRKEEKHFKTGTLTLQIWERKLRRAARRNKYPRERVEELIRRVRGDGDAPFIWEWVKGILKSMEFSRKEARLLRIRASMSASYIEAHGTGGFLLPTGSLAVGSVVAPQTGRYDLMRFRRVLQLMEVFYRIGGFTPRKVLSLKCKGVQVLKAIREGLEAGMGSEEVYRRLRLNGLVDEFRRMVADVDGGVVVDGSGGLGVDDAEQASPGVAVDPRAFGEEHQPLRSVTAEFYGTVQNLTISVPTVKEEIVAGDKIDIGGNVTGSAVGSKATLNARDIVTEIQQSGILGEDLQQAFRKAAEALATLNISEGDKEDVADDLHKLKKELEQPMKDEGRIQKIWNRIKEIAPTVASILASTAVIAKLVTGHP